MTKRHSLRIGLVMTALALLGAASGQAAGTFNNHENLITFSRPVALPGAVLPPGTYSFDVVSPTALDVVVVRTKDQRKTLYMGFTRTVERPRGMSPNAPIAFAEAPADQPRPISTWYEIGAPTGHQFLYQ